MTPFYCPFCNESVKLQIQTFAHEYAVVCLKCYASGSLAENEEMAVGLWNHVKRKKIKFYKKREEGYEEQ